MIDFDAIYNKFVSIAQEQVGSFLSQGGELGDEPHVIREGIAASKPDYPYITVAINDVTEEDGWQVNEFINDDDHAVHENIKTLMISYNCFGGESSSLNSDRAINIANQLHGSFMFSSVRSDIRSTLGGGIVRLSEVGKTQIKKANKILETASITILFNVVDSREDVNSFIIDTVDLTGDVYSLQGDDTPENITINITQP